jgi:hypothetical protein
VTSTILLEFPPFINDSSHLNRVLSLLSMLISLRHTPKAQKSMFTLPALQIPLQVRGASHQNHPRHTPALSFRTLTVQSRQLLVGQSSHVFAPVSTRMGAGDGGKWTFSSIPTEPSCFHRFRSAHTRQRPALCRSTPSRSISARSTTRFRALGI